MKSTYLKVSLGLLVATLSLPAFAKAKYGVVNMQKIILTVQEGKDARKGLEKEIKAKEKELTGKKAELDKMNKDWKTQAPLLSEEARLKKQKEFQEKFMTLRNEEMKFQNSIKQKEAQATQKIARKVAELATGMAKKKKLEAVFETNSAGLLYLQDPVDLTADIVKAYDKKTKKK